MYYLEEFPLAPVTRFTVPPMTEETAASRIKTIEAAWNAKDPKQIARFYSPDSLWRERAESFRGRKHIQAFLQRKWQRELDYRLKMDLWAFTENRIAVNFVYEWRDDSSNWFRSHGNELWQYCDLGRICQRIACINDEPIHETQRLLKEIDHA